MAEPLFENVNFTVEADQLEFKTRTNGDRIMIMGIDLNAEDAAALAYLVNQSEPLRIRIKINE